MEKQVLRDAFADSGLLPTEVLFRKKEAFSDGVSSTEKSWFQEIQTRIEDENLVAVGWEENAGLMLPRPPTPEAYWYRTLYDEFYGKTGDYWSYWMPSWSPETNDPSARTLEILQISS
jgi:asparagine synthase (glutamine-hydrolysing)